MTTYNFLCCGPQTECHCSHKDRRLAQIKNEITCLARDLDEEDSVDAMQQLIAHIESPDGTPC